MALVSQMQQVALRIDDVWEVRREAAGSSAWWRGTAENEVVMTEELAAGLPH